MTSTVTAAAVASESTRSRPRCVIVDDHEFIRDGLRVRLEGAAAVEVVGLASCSREALEVIEQVEPDLVILDVRLPDSDGISLTRRIVEQWPGVRVLLISGSVGPALVESAFAVGAAGFVSKASSSEMFVSAVRTITEGRRFIDPSMSVDMLDGVRLSPREREVLEMLVAGAQNAEIAHQLGVSLETVKAHVSNILAKLDVSSRTEAVVRSLRDGMVL